MEMAHSKEELIKNLDRARMVAKKIDYVISRMIVDVSKSKFRYNPYENGPKWFDNQCGQLLMMVQELDELVQI